jgi:ABC-2 type transport system permease protein
VNGVIAAITLRGMLGRRRALLLLLLPATLVALAIALLATNHAQPAVTAILLQRFGVATLLPLVALIAASGVLGTEIDDGSFVFLLSKPIPRSVIVNTKLAVAAGLTILFAAVPVLAAGLLMARLDAGIALGFAAGAAAGSIAYAAIFVLINVLTRHAVVTGLVYALIWETLVGEFVPGARQLSVQQWALSITDWVSSSPAIHAEVGVPAALVLLAVVTVGATVLAGQRLRSLSIAGEA